MKVNDQNAPRGPSVKRPGVGVKRPQMVESGRFWCIPGLWLKRLWWWPGMCGGQAEWPTQQQAGRVWPLVISLKFMASHSASVYRPLGKKPFQFYFLVIPNQKDGRKLETLVWRVVARHWRSQKNSGPRAVNRQIKETSKAASRASI